MDICFDIELKEGKCSDEIFVHYNEINCGAAMWEDDDDGISVP
jgi:hypothetical protein